MMQTVTQLLNEARAELPSRCSPRETFEEMTGGALVIDIRGDEQQRRDGLIPGAITIRRNVLEWRCDPRCRWRHAKIKSHSQRVILVCDQGYQSSLAAANLQRLGLKRATDMSGGFSRWKKLGLPIVPYDNETPVSVLDKFKSAVRSLFR